MESEEGQGPSSQTAEVVVRSFETIGAQNRATAVFALCLGQARVPAAQAPASTALSRAGTVAESAPRALPAMPSLAWNSTTKLTKLGTLACEARGCQRWP